MTKSETKMKTQTQSEGTEGEGSPSSSFIPHPSSLVPATLIDLGTMEYGAAWNLQKEMQAEQIEGKRGAAVLFVEHPPVITVGRRGESADVVAPAKVLERRGIAVTETDRGGQVTYHGPGQLVVYPLVNLQDLKLGLHEYMRAMEEIVLRTIAEWGLKGYRVEDRTGVWVGKDKICAMGIRVRRWWTIHGLALNVTTDLNHFGMIVPCGIRDRGVTSMQKLLGDACPSMPEVKARVAAHLGEVLGVRLE